MGKSSRKRRRGGQSGMYSSMILGAIVDALGVDEGFLAEKTAKRFFKSGHASEYSRNEVFRALGQMMVEQGLVPDVDEKLPEGRRTADAIADGVCLMCKRWDLLMERIRSRSAAVVDVGGAGQKFLRLAVVDMALRILGFTHLAGLEIPEPHVPVWAQSNGFGEILRGRQREVGLRRHQLAARLEVSPTTVDNWLDGKNFPGQAYLPALSRVLSEGTAVSTEGLEAQFRRQLALARIADLAASAVGWDEVASDVEAAFWFSKFMQEFDGLSRLPGGHADAAALMLALMGSLAPFAPLLLWPLAERLEAYEWSDDIYAVASSVGVQFEKIAGEHSGGRLAAGLAQDYFDVVDEPSPEDIEANMVIMRTLRWQMADVLPFKPVMDGRAHPVVYFERAVDLRRELVERYPGSAEAHFNLGSMLGLAGQRLRRRFWVDEGIMECKIAAGLAPGWDAPTVEPGIILANLEDWDGALRELEMAESLLPEATLHLRNVRGYALMNAGRFEEALADYLVVVNDRPDFGSAWGDAAHCTFSLGNSTRGLEFAKKARALGEPRVYDAWDKGAYGRRRKRRAD